MLEREGKNVIWKWRDLQISTRMGLVLVIIGEFDGLRGSWVGSSPRITSPWSLRWRL